MLYQSLRAMMSALDIKMRPEMRPEQEKVGIIKTWSLSKYTGSNKYSTDLQFYGVK